MANGIESLDPNLWEKIKRLMNPIDDKGRMKTGGMNMSPEDARFAAELGLDFTPGVGDVKALLYDMPRSLRDARNAPTPLGKAGHAGLATLAGLSAIPVMGKPFDFLRAALKARKARKLNAPRIERKARIKKILEEFDKLPVNISRIEHARLGRMADEGFDTALYHGTWKPQDPDNPWEYLKPGRDEGMDIYGEGVYLGDKRLANIFSGDVGMPGQMESRIYPAMVRGEKIFDMKKFREATNETYKNVRRDWTIPFSKLAYDKARADYMESLGFPGLHDTTFYDITKKGLDKRSNILKKLGYQGFREGDTVIVWDPTNIRSPYAQFQDMGSKDILANWVGPALLGTGMAARATRDRENYVERYKDGGILSLLGRDR
jgi:hypothetical protein